jgi:Protein of unknown function (DUF3102)
VTNIATIRKTQVARPLKVLIPLIQSELQQGDTAGRDHYRRAGEMLLEAKDQVGYGAWGRWLTKNFELNHGTANRYMRWARIHNDPPGNKVPASMRELRGTTDRDREERQSKQQQQFRRVLRDVARDDFVQERQDRKDELALHQDLALELIEIGYRALATRLHPDRGGTKDAMSRLNRVRDELKQVAQTRKFI